jgi:hypothetical protein
MHDVELDPPPTLAAAEPRFQSFLRSQKLSEIVCWLMPGDVVVADGPHFWVRKRGTETLQYANARYVEGLRRNLGILFEVICATEKETFAAVFIPEDEIDAQYRLMGRGLKISCPVKRYATSATTTLFRWSLLRWRYGKRSGILE